MDILKKFGVYEVVGYAEREKDFLVIVKAQDGETRLCAMKVVPPKVFRVIKDGKGELDYQAYPAPQSFSIST